MKLSKIVFYFSTFISIITLILGITLNFCFAQNPIVNFIVNIFMNIFAGTIVLIGTSLFEYFLSKVEVLKSIMLECTKILKLVSNIDYLAEDNVENLERQQLIDLAQKYVKTINYDITNFLLLIDELNFLVDYRRKKIQEYNKLFFKKVNNLFELLYSEGMDLENYILDINYKNKQGDKIIFNTIKKMQDGIFYYEETSNFQDNDCKKKYPNYEEIQQEIYLGVNEKNNKHIFLVNKFEYDLKIFLIKTMKCEIRGNKLYKNFKFLK